MQIDPQSFLRLVETAKTLGFVDIEASGLKGDYNSVIVVSVRRYGLDPVSFSVRQCGNDQKVVREAKELLEELDCWVTYYGKGFDLPMLNTRLLRWKTEPIAKRPHVDLYYTLKSNLLTARRSQAHLLEWVDTAVIDAILGAGLAPTAAAKEAVKKMTVSAEMWNAILAKPRKFMPTMIARCESDVEGLETLYDRTKHLIRDIKR